MVVNRMTGSRRWHWRIAAALSFFASTGAWAAWEWNFQPAVTPLAREIVSLHALIFWICVVIGVLVFGAGLANSSVLHDTAHDTRHSYGFPCH